MQRQSTTHLAAALLSTLLVVGCVSKPTQKDSPPGAAAGKSEDKTKGEKIRDQERAVEKAEREVQYAKVAANLASMQSEHGLQAAEDQVKQAEHQLLLAEQELERFRKVDRVIQADESALTLARAQNRLQQAETDLAGILQIYEEEGEARSKSEIIRRHQQSVEFAKQGLAIAGLGADRVTTYTIPAGETKLQVAVEKAQAALAKAHNDQLQARLKLELESTKKTDAEKESRRDLADAKRELRKLEGRDPDAQEPPAPDGDGGP